MRSIGAGAVARVAGDVVFWACVVVILLLVARGARRRVDYAIAFTAAALAAALGLPPEGRDGIYLAGQVSSGGLLVVLGVRVASLPPGRRVHRPRRSQRLAWGALLWAQALAVGLAALAFPFHVGRSEVAWMLIGVGILLLVAERMATGRWVVSYVKR
jgi:predicted permease